MRLRSSAASRLEEDSRASTGCLLASSFQGGEHLRRETVLGLLEHLALLEPDVIVEDPTELAYSLQGRSRLASQLAKARMVLPNTPNHVVLAKDRERREKVFLLEQKVRLELAGDRSPNCLPDDGDRRLRSALAAKCNNERAVVVVREPA
jgi:hypothetical protein